MSYQGHKNRAHWSVALWIANEEGLYRLALECLKETRTLDQAAERFLEAVGATETPDGAKYSKSAVRAAIRDLN